MERISVIIPTLNAEKYIKKQIDAIWNQSARPMEVIVIDSDSEDRTREIAEEKGCTVYRISRSEFDHGGTRNFGARKAKGEILIFLTQDALPADREAFVKLIEPLRDSKVACSFGRQIPYDETDPFGKHLRYFNYPEKSYTVSYNDRVSLGFRTVFFSNSFSAFKKNIFNDLGGFPERVIFGEDTITCGKILKKGYKVSYVAGAVVFHSHSYSMFDEFRRYFDIGVMHRDYDWLIKEFGKPSGKGFEYLISELKYLFKKGYIHLIPLSFLRNFLKFLGYNLGKQYNLLPHRLRYYLSMNRTWWINKN